MIPRTKQGFINQSGQYFDKVMEIAYQKGELFDHLGTLVAQTSNKKDSFSESFSFDTEGVLIYQSKQDPFTAHRIYQAYAEPGFDGNGDDKLIQKLMERQSSIFLTSFPWGVVTSDGNIIGQEIPFYPNDITLSQFLKRYPNVNPIKIYRAVLEVLKEMYDCEILYLDIHPGNFMIDPSLSNIKIHTIDFDNTYVKIADFTKYNKEMFFDNYKQLLIKSNKILGIYDNLEELSSIKVDNFHDTTCLLDDIEKQYLKRK